MDERIEEPVVEKAADVTVVQDLGEVARWAGIAMDARRHRVLPDGDFILWARRRFSRPTLFEYEHLESGNLVLADWIIKGQVAQELEVYAPDDRPDPAYLEERMVPAQEMAERALEKIRKVKEMRESLRREIHEGNLDKADFLRRRGAELSATILELGGRPWGDDTPGDDVDEWKSELVSMASGRVISLPT